MNRNIPWKEVPPKHKKLSILLTSRVPEASQTEIRDNNTHRRFSNCELLCIHAITTFVARTKTPLGTIVPLATVVTPIVAVATSTVTVAAAMITALVPTVFAIASTVIAVPPHWEVPAHKT
ncbi:unnamed protein product [Clonostachys byssicola]|uniref:Uncharacterized protein n=1 Tax=Clonostachys byssicola TaxID=160290 RepID=A0A9N9XTX1_9HYPO|nr:unnamed protein product [Clonostachys byssicola]